MLQKHINTVLRQKWYKDKRFNVNLNTTLNTKLLNANPNATLNTNFSMLISTPPPISIFKVNLDASLKCVLNTTPNTILNLPHN